MALSRVHTSAKAADVAKLLLLNKTQVRHPAVRSLVMPYLTGNRSFSHLSPKTSNSLPLELRLAPTFDTFRRRLKTYLFG